MTVALATVLGQVDPALVTVKPTTFKPTPNEVKVAVCPAITFPGPVVMLQLPRPKVNAEALTVVLGVSPHIVWVTGLNTAGLVIGSTTIVAVALVFGQVEPALVTLYLTTLVPTPNPVKLVVP